MNIREALTAGLLVLEEALDNPTFRFASVDIVCVPSTLERGTFAALGGMQVLVGLTLIARRSHWLTWGDEEVTLGDETFTLGDESGANPISGQKLTYRGTSYRVISVRESADRSHLSFILADPNSNQ